MGSAKIIKPSELREDLYQTLNRVCRGERHLVPTKEGDVLLISKVEYDSILEDLDFQKVFEGPIDLKDPHDSEDVLQRLGKKHGFILECNVELPSRRSRFPDRQR